MQTITQSKTAIGSGGLTGKGYLEGTQSHLHFLPEGHTDFIIAAFSEEFGLLGVSVLMFIYSCILIRCLYIAAIHVDTFGRLLAGTCCRTERGVLAGTQNYNSELIAALDEIKDLKKQLRIAQEEREILKKATAYFAKNQ